MRQKFKIVPRRQNGNISVVGSYKDKRNDKEVFLIGGGKKVVNTLEEKDRVFSHVFENGMPLELTYDQDDFKDQMIIDFWKNHPLVETDGYENNNLVMAEFELEIKDEIIAYQYNFLIEEIECVAQVIAMTEQQRRDLTFALGYDPREMSDKEVFVNLIGIDLDGYAIEDMDLVHDYLTIRGKEKIATVYANKAVVYGTIKKEGSVYKIAGRNAGTDIDEVISFLLADNDVFENYVKPEVDKVDKNGKTEKIDPLDLPDEIKNLIPATDALKKKQARSKATD